MSAIVVGVRVRPFNQRELKYNSVNIVSMEDGGKVSLKVVRQGKVIDNEKPKEFVFDHLFWTHDQSQPYATQEIVYEKMGRDCLKNVLEGYNSCLFAYGQTGSGKTYSMMGYGEELGVIPHLCEELFEQVLDLRKQSILTAVECSYLEIYNENVKDLLSGDMDAKPLKIRQHPKTGVFVEGLKKVQVTSRGAILDLLDEGNAVRAVAATSMNANSSRSHAVLLLTVVQTNVDTSAKAGKLSLVDLAGSERASSTGATGDTLAEGSNINRSLSTLGMCLAKLADVADGKTGQHVPYRDSSLTFLLSESLGGNSKTAMLANISPAEINHDETLSTLRFAQVTKKVKNHAIVNENPTTKLIRELREELAMLKEQLRQCEAACQDVPTEVLQMIHNSEAAAKQLEKKAEAWVEEEEEEEAAEKEPAIEVASKVEPSVEPQPPPEAPTTNEAPTQIVEQPNDVQQEPAPLPPTEPLSPQPQQPPKTEVADQSTAEKTLSKKRRKRDVSGASVFVDWRRPQLINLCPEGSTLVLHIEDGTNTFLIDYTTPASQIDVIARRAGRLHAPCGADNKVTFSITFTPLLNTTTFQMLRPGKESPQRTLAPYINGQLVAAQPLISSKSESREASPPIAPQTDGVPSEGDWVYTSPLSHSDRLVIGKVAFRFANSSSLDSATAYSPFPKSLPHVEALECFVRLRDVVREYYTGINVVAQSLPSERRNSVNDEEGSDTEQSESLEETITEITATMRQAEEMLIVDFPITAEDQARIANARCASGTSAAASEEMGYEAVIAEQKKGLEQKDTLIDKLRQDIARASEARRKREMSMVRRAKVAQEQKEKEEAEIARAAEDELAWHAQVRKIRTFNLSGPADAEDRAMWLRLCGPPDKTPFLQEIIEMQQLALRHSSMMASATADSTPALNSAEENRIRSLSSTVDSSTGSSVVTQRGLAPKKCGTFFKQSSKNKRWEQRFGVIHKRFFYYFHKCDGREHAGGAFYLYGAVVAALPPTKALDRPNCVHLTCSVPRRPNDINSFFLAFPNENDAALWMEWITNESTPPMPPSMARRMKDEYEEAVASGKRKPLVQVATGASYQGGDAATTEGDQQKSNWKANETVKCCEDCQASFHMLRRRHHCRDCGRIFCDNCAPLRKEKGVRLCKACFAAPATTEPK